MAAPTGAADGELMDKWYVYNKTRQSFLSLGVEIADTHFKSLKGLLGKRRLQHDDGLWVIPCQGIHTIGMLFSIDVLFLDADLKVIHMVENLSPFRIGPIRVNCQSVLEMPTRTIFSSHTQVGDHLMICSVDQMKAS
jgi:uncharacterized membrane protein (UPF0127 family)